jgi:hypothetical protein
MKKIISVLLTLALVLSLVPAVFAADEPTFSLSADKESAGADDTVTLTVNFSNNATTLEIGALNFEIVYDEDAYTFVSADSENYDAYFSSSDAGTSLGNGKATIGGILITVGSKPVKMNDGALATYTFKANDVAAESASFKLEITKLTTHGTTRTDIANKVVGGELTIPVTGGSVTPEGYSVSIPETKSVTTGETVEIPITISGKDYNAYSVCIRYYTDVLELQNNAVNNEGFRLSEEKYTDADYRPGSKITLVRYGDTAQPGKALSLTFTAKAQGTTDVTILRARVDERANSISFNAPDATITNGTTAVTVSGYTVSLPDDFTRTDTAGTVIMEGKNLTFVPKDPNYDYTVTVTVGGVEALPTVGEDGTYTVANVTGNVVVTSTKTPKSFNVTLGADTTGDTTATYQTDYTFKLTPVDGYVYNMAVTIGDTDYTGFTAQKNDDGTTTYTIPGAAITGDIVINSNKKERDPYTFQVTFEGTGIGDVSNNATTVTENDPYSFTLTKKDGFDYTVSATMDGAAVELTETVDTGNANVVTYSIAKVTGDLVITVNKVSTLNMDVAVSEYVQMDDKTVFLVTVTGTPTEGMAYAYGENTMYKTTAYGVNVYSWLVIVDKNQEFTADTAKANIKEASATAEEMAPSYDVNETKTVDINDAQLVYDIYSGKYGDFDKVTVKKFLCADVNSDKIVDSTDAVAVVKASK